MAVSALQEDRKKALNLAIAQIEKSCGKGSIMRMGADTARVRVEAIPTGAINLDAAIGVGGIPRGRVTEVYGPESSGKTTLCLHVVASAQRAGGVAAFIDAEHALDIEYAKKTSKRSSCRSRTPASRRSRSARFSLGPAPSTSS
jgi:recombination protein RecA